MQKLRLFFVLVLVTLLMSVSLPSAMAEETTPLSASDVTPPQPYGFWTTATAYTVSTAYLVGLEPHYGAFFSGGSGRNQHYLGPGGDSATCASSSGCIANWNWWGADLSVLLLPKSGWLLTEVPWVGPKWQGYNYQATIFIQ